MQTGLTFLLALAFAALVAGAVSLWRRLESQRRAEDLRALAARRGWSLVVTPPGLGRRGDLRLQPRGGLPWTLRARGAETVFEAAAPRWAEGTLVAFAPGGAPPGGPPAGLARVEAPEGLVALSDGEPRLRVQLDDLARALGGWAPLGRGERGVPVLQLGPEGLSLRLGHGVARADRLERFVDLAQELSRLIGP